MTPEERIKMEEEVVEYSRMVFNTPDATAWLYRDHLKWGVRPIDMMQDSDEGLKKVYDYIKFHAINGY